MILPAQPDIALLILRVVAGIIFIVHGKEKFARQWSTSKGLPYFIGILCGIGMIGGGLSILFGFLTQIAAFGPLIVMLGAVYFHKIKWKHPFIDAKGPSYEYPLVLALIALGFVLMGAGAYSIDALLGY